MIGEEFASSGRVLLDNINVSRDRWSALQNIGYCDQFDTYLIAFMSCRDHLRLFARLHNAVDVDGTVEAALRLFELHEYRHRASCKLSGGNKRKLASALALMGRRKIVVLDEPSAGIDPSSRRKLWSMMQNVTAVPDDGTQRSNRCLMLTSHSLEEAEALCRRVAIMVSGRLRCIGSLQRLREKFGNRLQVQATAVSQQNGIEDLLQLMRREVSEDVELVEVQGLSLRFEVPKNNENTLSKVFEVMQKAQREAICGEYGIGDMSLDQILMELAREDDSAHKRIRILDDALEH